MIGKDVSVFPWQHRAQQQPGVVALVTPQHAYTWRDIDNMATAYAKRFQQQGMQPGDVLTVIGKNRVEWIGCFLGAMLSGLVTAFLAPQPQEKLIQKLKTLYRPEQPIWLAEPSLSQPALDLSGAFEDIRRINACFPPADIPEQVYETSGQAGQLCSLIFTSGSTGVPKAVAHRISQHIASAKGLLSCFPFRQQDCWLLSLPLYHVSGLSIVFRWLYAGGRLKTGDDLDLISAIQGVTHASLVPVQLQRLLDSKIELNLTHVLLGGGQIPSALTQQARACGIATWVGYGMTEAASTVTARETGEPEARGYGYPLPGREVELREQRIYVRGDTLAAGYFGQGTLKTVTDEQGWFDTKDLGFWSDDGLHITGRADNQFISGGENIHCEEVEQALLMHPQIDLAVVVPVHDLKFGARPVAVIHSISDVLPTVAAMETWLSYRLEKFKWPVAYYALPQSLQTDGIKISRFEVKQWLAASEQQLKVMR